MRYQLTQRLFALGDKGVMTDEQGRAVYRNNGKFFSIHDRVSVVDMQGKEVATLHSKLLSFPKRMIVEIGGTQVATIATKAISFRPKYNIELASGERWKITGDLLNHAYTLEDEEGATVAQITKAWVAATDRYGIEIAEGREELLVLMLAVGLESFIAESEDAD